MLLSVNRPSFPGLLEGPAEGRTEARVAGAPGLSFLLHNADIITSDHAPVPHLSVNQTLQTLTPRLTFSRSYKMYGNPVPALIVVGDLSLAVHVVCVSEAGWSNTGGQPKRKKYVPTRENVADHPTEVGTIPLSARN